jgi:hypothetical protein
MCIIPAATPLLLSVWRDPTPNLPNLGVSTKRCVRPLQKSQSKYRGLQRAGALDIDGRRGEALEEPLPKIPREMCCRPAIR